jgi:multiple sugar transport system ATP-binding protein
VALARAIVRKPAVFLMDEPLSNLDAKLRVSMRSHIKHLHHKLGVTTIYVTHDQIEAMTLADRVVVMSKAEIQQIGTPETIYNDPANLFVASFIGNPAMNLIQGQIVDGDFIGEAGLRVPGVAHDTPVPKPQAVVLGVRPEDVQLCPEGRGDVQAPVFSFELTGDATLVTLRVGTHFLTARGSKDTRCPIGTMVSMRLPPDACFLFDAASQNRLRRSAH